MQIGDIVKRKRTDLNLTQKDLEDSSGVTQSDQGVSQLDIWVCYLLLLFPETHSFVLAISRSEVT